MEGIIWKWTNYWAGWQPRWFVLEDGALSYYKSQDEVNQSCKGSIKMSVCEIIVHPTDANRLDLVIPSEQHFYLRLATSQERQQWLVALGSAKASLSARQKKKSPEAITSASVAAVGAVGSSEQILKSRTSELRLYCDLLMQQVHMVKSAATDKKPPDIEVLNDATSLLGATCDTFIKALEDCMRIASASLGSDPSQRTWIESTLLSSSSNNCRSELRRMQPTHKSKSTGDRPPSPMLREHSRESEPSEHWQNHNQNNHHLLCESDPDTESSTENDDRTLNDEFEDAQETHESQSHCSSTSSDNTSQATKCSPQAPEYCNGDEDKLVRQTSLPAPPPPPRIKTFFSNLEVSFLNMKLTADGGIPTKHFLESCAIVITIFEMFGSPIFAPMKMDVNGNLRKIRDKHVMNPERFHTLQSIILYEMDTGTTLSRNAATDAIMWLKRGLEFVREFLREFHRGNMDLKQCALFAYNRTLKQYHGWIVRNIISTATRTVPCREEVLLKLALNPEDVKNPCYEDELVLDAKRFTKAMDTIIRILNDFYLRHNLERKEVI